MTKNGAISLDKCKRLVSSVKKTLHPGRWDVDEMPYGEVCREGLCESCFIDIVNMDAVREYEDTEPRGAIAFDDFGKLGVKINADIPTTSHAQIVAIRRYCDIDDIHEHDGVKHVHVPICDLPDFLEAAKRI